MPSIDMPLDQLRQYKPGLYREEDFESFWDETVAAALKQPLNAELIPFDLPAQKGLRVDESDFLRFLEDRRLGAMSMQSYRFTLFIASSGANE